MASQFGSTTFDVKNPFGVPLDFNEELRKLSELQGGLGGFNVDDFLAMFQQSQDDANAKNEERFTEINAGFDAQLARAIELLEGQGNFARQQIGEASEQAIASDQADLTSRGLANTTVLQSNRQGIRRDRDLAFGALSEQTAFSQFAAETSITSQQLAFQERREDVPLDLNSILPLLLQLFGG